MPSYTLSNWDGSLTKKQEVEHSKGLGSTANFESILKPNTTSDIFNIQPKASHDSSSTNTAGRVAQPYRVAQEGSSCGTYAFDKTRPSIPTREATSSREIFNVGVSVMYTSPTSERVLSADTHMNSAMSRSISDAQSSVSMSNRLLPTPILAPRTPPKPTTETKEKRMDAIDIISIHSSDAEGEDEEDEVIIVQNMLSIMSPQKQLDDPPPRFLSSSPPLGPFDELFTPPPDKIETRPRSFLAYVEVPPLRKGLNKQDYKRLFRPRPRPRRPSVQVHQSIGDALAATWKNNTDLGTLSSVQVKQKKTNHTTTKAVPGSSTSISRVTSKPTKKRRHQYSDDEDWAKKKPRTKSYPLSRDVSASVAPSQPQVQTVPRNFKQTPLSEINSYGSTNYIGEKGTVNTMSDRIKVASSLATVFNTRYLRVDGKNIVAHDKGKGKAKNDTDIAEGWFRWPPSVAFSTLATDDEDTISAGGSILKAWEDSNQVIEIEVTVEKQVETKPVPLIFPSPPKKTPIKTKDVSIPRIDLAEQFRKKKVMTSKKYHLSGVDNGTDVSVAGNSPSGSILVRTMEPPRSERTAAQGVHRTPSQPSIPSSTQQSGNLAISPSAIPPSSKAIGKRRAVTPPAQAISELTQHRINGAAVNLFLPETDSSPLNRTYFSHNLDINSQPNIYPNAESSILSSLSPMNYLRDNAAANHLLYERDVVDEQSAFLTNPNPLPFYTGLEGLRQYTHNPWTTLDQPDYQYQTINPTLLHDTPDIDLQDTTMANFEDNWNSQDSQPFTHATVADGPLSRSISPSSSSSSRSPSLARASSSRLQVRERNTSLGSTSSRENLVLPSRRKPVQRKFHDDMVRVDQLDLSSKTSESAYQSSGSTSGDDAEFDERNEGRRPIKSVSSVRKGSTSTTVKGGRASKRITTRVPPPTTSSPASTYIVPSGIVWARGSEEAYCHQCRTKSDKLKMKCETCSKLYCNRCIMMRYPKVVFAKKFPDLCPICDRTCNCDICCRKRGETFISMKGKPGVNAGMVVKKPKPRKEKDKGKGKEKEKPKPPTRLPPATHVISGPVAYWGHVYSLTGERVATGFIEAGGNDSVVFARHINSVTETNRKKLFVGAIQASWNLGTSSQIVEVNPISKKSGGKNNKGRKQRSFIGKEELLYLPCAPARGPLIFDDDDPGAVFASSPLSSLPESEDGEGDRTFSDPASLQDNDVARAIALGFNACGVFFQTEEEEKPESGSLSGAG